MDIKEYLDGETLKVEYKYDNKAQIQDKKISESAVAFANSEGGVILIGVADNGVVEGSTNWSKKHSAHSIEAIILQNTQPNLSTSVVEAEYQNKKVIVIKVPKSSTVVGTRSGKYLKRILDQNGKPGNNPMSPTEIAGNVATVSAMDFSTTHLANCDFSSIDTSLVREVSTELKKRVKINKNEAKELLFDQEPKGLLKALGLMNDQDQPNIAGLLIFGFEDFLRNRLPNAFVQYQVFGTKGEILENKRLSSPLVKLIPELLEFKNFHLNSDEFVYRGSSVVIPEYADTAIREAIANALVHRDYTHPNPIQIQIHPNELTITSPGGFPRGVTIDSLLSAPPTPRNRRLAEALYRLGFVETSGRGIDFIFHGQAKYGRPAPDYSASNKDRVSVRIAGGKANLDFCKVVLSIKDELKIDHMLLLNKMFFDKEITLDDASKVIQKPLQSTNEILMSMHKNELVEILGTNNKKYFLKASISPFVAKKVIPKRLSLQNKENYKSRIKETLSRGEEFSREILADAVGLSPSQCYRLLKELKTEGVVGTTPSRKWKKQKITKGDMKEGIF